MTQAERDGQGIISWSTIFSDMQYRISDDFRNATTTTDGIQEAIDDLPPDGGVVFIPRGVHEVSATITIANPDVKIMGSGNASVVRLAGGSNVDVFALTIAAARAEMCGFAIDGAMEVNALGSGIAAVDSVNLHIHHMYIYHCAESGIQTNFATVDPFEDVIESNHIHGCGGDGIYLETIARSCAVRDNTCNNNLNGIRVGTTVTGGPCVVTGNICNWNTNSGILINVNETVISDNLCSSNAHHGIYIYARGGARVVDNVTMYNQRDGIRIYRSDGCLVSDNRTSDNGDGWANIHIEGDGTDTADDNIVSGNHCMRFGAWLTDYGIRILGGANANGNLITGNVCLGNDVEQINDVGQDTRYGHNITN